MYKPSRIVGWGSAVLLALLATGVAQAEREVYFDAAYGRAQLDEDSPGLAVADDTNAWRVGAGFDFGNYIAIELGYLNLGDLDDTTNAGPVAGQTDGYTFNIRFEMPLSETLSAGAKVGAFVWESELATPLTTFRDNGEDLFYGISLDFAVTPNLTVSGEWDRFEFDDGEADVIFAGLRYRF